LPFPTWKIPLKRKHQYVLDVYFPPQYYNRMANYLGRDVLWMINDFIIDLLFLDKYLMHLQVVNSVLHYLLNERWLGVEIEGGVWMTRRLYVKLKSCDEWF